MTNNSMYKKVYQEVKEKIDMGAYSAGELLPTELELGKQFGVSRTTIRRAIDLLARDGYLQAKQGYGTEVLDYKTKQSLNAVTSISETLRKKGVHVRSKSIYIDTFDAPPQLADKLQIPTGTLLTRVQRIQLGDEKPIAIMQNYLVSDTVPDLQLFTKSTNSFYLYLEDKYGIIIDKAHDRITARAATFVEAEMLQIPIGTALIVFDRICYQQEKPVCVDHLKIVGDRYEFELTLTGRNAYGK